MQGRQVDARTRALVQAPCQVTMRGHVNPMEDAAAERRRATFNPDELAAFLHGGEDKMARRWAVAGAHGAGRPLGDWRRSAWSPLGTGAPQAQPGRLPPLPRRREELIKLLSSQPWGDKTLRYFLTRECERAE